MAIVIIFIIIIIIIIHSKLTKTLNEVVNLFKVNDEDTRTTS